MDDFKADDFTPDASTTATTAQDDFTPDKKDAGFFEGILSFANGLKQKAEEAFNQKQQQDTATQQAQAAHDADPENWSSTRFKKEAPKPTDPVSQAAYDQTLQQKQDAEDASRKEFFQKTYGFDPVKHEEEISKLIGSDVKIETLKPQSFFDKISNLVKKTYILGPIGAAIITASDAISQQNTARKANVVNLAQYTSLDPVTISKHYDDITQKLALRDYPNAAEIINAGMLLGLPVSVDAYGALAVAKGIAKFTVVKEGVERGVLPAATAVWQAINKEPVKYEVKKLQDYFPDDQKDVGTISEYVLYGLGAVGLDALAENPRVLGEINGIRYRILKAMGVKQETGLEPLTVEQTREAFPDRWQNLVSESQKKKYINDLKSVTGMNEEQLANTDLSEDQLKVLNMTRAEHEVIKAKYEEKQTEKTTTTQKKEATSTAPDDFVPEIAPNTLEIARSQNALEPPINQPEQPIQPWPIDHAANDKVMLKGAGPQPHTIIAELPKQEGDLPDERFFTVQNNKTGKQQTIEASDIKNNLSMKARQANADAQSETRTLEELANNHPEGQGAIDSARQSLNEQEIFERAKSEVLADVSRGLKPKPDSEPPASGVRSIKGKLPKIIKNPKERGLKLTSGIDPGVDKFYAEDLKPAAQKAREAADITFSYVKEIGNAFIKIFEPAKPVEMKHGQKAYSDVIRAFHTPERALVEFDSARSKTLDQNFEEAEEWFDKFPEKDLRNFNLTRGEPDSPEAIALKQNALTTLRPELSNPSVIGLIKDASDYVYKIAQDSGLELGYFKDYFYGTYQNPARVDQFLDYWRTTDRFTKDKAFPTIADAEAFGLKLKDPNPIRNIKSELRAVAQKVALEDLKTKTDGAPFSVDIDKASPLQKQSWKAIEDPSIFRGKLYEPRYADFVNSLLSTNKVMTNPITKGLRSSAYLFQKIKFFGSVLHMQNMAKAELAIQNAGIANPKGWAEIAKGFKVIDKTEPEYHDYVNLGGGHRYSIESQSQEMMSQALDKIGRGNYLGGLLRLPIGLIQSKFVPASPGFIKWMFQDYIPKLKYNAFKNEALSQQNKLDRELTDGEKIKIIKQNQNFFGEINERLFGRSGTVTSALRIIFSAPGYGEGDFRTAGKAAAGDKRSAWFIFNTLVGTLLTATMGTYFMTGKWPQAPKRKEDIRDLFKMKTGFQDGNGDDVYYDMMTYDKDYWALFGNAAIGHADKIIPELSKRLSGMVSTPMKVLSDLTDLALGKPLVDYKRDPVFYQTDPFSVKLQKLMMYEFSGLSPISAGTYGQAVQKGVPAGQAAVGAILGVRPAPSEQAKENKAKISDFYDIRNATEKKKMALDKLFKENPEEAKLQRFEYNKQVRENLKNVGINADRLPAKIMKELLVTNLHIPKGGSGDIFKKVIKNQAEE